MFHYRVAVGVAVFLVAVIHMRQAVGKTYVGVEELGGGGGSGSQDEEEQPGGGQGIIVLVKRAMAKGCATDRDINSD